MEHGSDDLDVVASQAETEVVKDTPEVAASAASPFGSAAEVVEEEVARELPPILDLPESETSSGKTAPELEVPTFESAPAPAEEPELSRMSEPVAEAPAEEPELSRMSEPVAEAPAPVETAPAMSAEKSIYDDPMFGPIKRLLVEFVGED